MKEGDGEKGRGWEGGRERENHLPSLQHDRKVTKIKYTKKTYLNKTNQQKKREERETNHVTFSKRPGVTKRFLPKRKKRKKREKRHE